VVCISFWLVLSGKRGKKAQAKQDAQAKKGAKAAQTAKKAQPKQDAKAKKKGKGDANKDKPVNVAKGKGQDDDSDWGGGDGDEGGDPGDDGMDTRGDGKDAKVSAPAKKGAKAAGTAAQTAKQTEENEEWLIPGVEAEKDRAAESAKHDETATAGKGRTLGARRAGTKRELAALGVETGKPGDHESVQDGPPPKRRRVART